LTNKDRVTVKEAHLLLPTIDQHEHTVGRILTCQAYLTGKTRKNWRTSGTAHHVQPEVDTAGLCATSAVKTKRGHCIFRVGRKGGNLEAPALRKSARRGCEQHD
jgi:hypothetical protein